MAQRLSRREFIDRAQRVALATPLLSLLGCSEETAAGGLSLAGRTMGTTYSVRLAQGLSDGQAETLGREVDGLLETVNRQMSTYRPDSELSRFNAAAPEAWTEVSADTRRVIDEALRVSRLTGGAFDPTVGPLVDLWGFGPDGGQDRVPPEAEVIAARASVGHDKIETSARSSAFTKSVPGLRLDLSGVAKGFGVDQVARHLEAQGIADFLVEVGGELRAAGRGPAGRSWQVGIESPAPASAGDLQEVVALEDAALATSGNYRIFFEADGRRYSHIVDPVTGRPVAHDLASASVLADSAMEADALSTALLVLGPERGMELAVAHDIAAFFVSGRAGAFTEAVSPTFARRLKG